MPDGGIDSKPVVESREASFSYGRRVVPGAFDAGLLGATVAPVDTMAP
jgi:hypothetical protein